jgi:hypothetical protein
MCSTQNVEPALMAEVRVLKEGRQPPGNMYSLIKSELLRYSSYLSSGIVITCLTTTQKKNFPKCKELQNHMIRASNGKHHPSQFASSGRPQDFHTFLDTCYTSIWVVERR